MCNLTLFNSRKNMMIQLSLKMFDFRHLVAAL